MTTATGLEVKGQTPHLPYCIQSTKGIAVLSLRNPTSPSFIQKLFQILLMLTNKYIVTQISRYPNKKR